MLRRSESLTDLDSHLVDYLCCLDNQLKIIRRLKKFTYNEPWISVGEHRILKKIEFYESMLSKPVKRKSKINIRRTFANVIYMVRFVYIFKHMLVLRRNKK